MHELIQCSLRHRLTGGSVPRQVKSFGEANKIRATESSPPEVCFASPSFLILPAPSSPRPQSFSGPDFYLLMTLPLLPPAFHILLPTQTPAQIYRHLEPKFGY